MSRATPLQPTPLFINPPAPFSHYIHEDTIATSTLEGRQSLQSPQIPSATIIDFLHRAFEMDRINSASFPQPYRPFPFKLFCSALTPRQAGISSSDEFDCRAI